MLQHGRELLNCVKIQTKEAFLSLRTIKYCKSTPTSTIKKSIHLPISIIVAPKLHISEDLPAPDCLITSGAIQGTDPLKANMLSSSEAVHKPAILFEHPKSANFATPVSVTKILAPLMSRWIIPLSCKYPTPLIM